jgi:hypothetical protein
MVKKSKHRIPVVGDLVEVLPADGKLVVSKVYFSGNTVDLEMIGNPGRGMHGVPWNMLTYPDEKEAPPGNGPGEIKN